MKKRGFTIIEMLFALVIFAVLSIFYFQNNNKEIDLRRSKALAEQANVHAKTFINYLVANESSISAATSTTAPIIISMDQLIASGNVQTVTGVNLISQKPCLSIIKNGATKKIEAIMYYVAAKSNPTISSEFLQKAALSLNELAGVYNGSGVKTSSWNLPSSSVYFLNSGQCVSGYSLRPNSLVVNLNLYPEFNHSIHPDIGLHRILDPNKATKPLGTPGNLNTSLTDIVTNGKDLLLNNTANLKLTANNPYSLGVNGANLSANTIEATSAIGSGTQCNPSDEGTIARQGDFNVGNTQSNVVCSYNPLLCPGTGYCYTPVLNNTIIYKDVSNSGWMGTTFTCPAHVPYLQSATAYQAGNPNPYITYQTSSWNNYTMARGAIAHGNSGWNCTNWQVNYQYPCKLGVPVNWEISDMCVPGGTFNPRGQCIGWARGKPCTDEGLQGLAHTCTNWTPPPPIYINSATCTSKLIIKAN